MISVAPRFLPGVTLIIYTVSEVTRYFALHDDRSRQNVRWLDGK